LLDPSFRKRSSVVVDWCFAVWRRRWDMGHIGKIKKTGVTEGNIYTGVML
jgi:hypothetical protein